MLELTLDFHTFFWRVSLQTTHVLRVYNVLSIHEWSEEIPTENDDVIYEQPFSPLEFWLLLVRWYSIGNLLTGTLLGKLEKECKYSGGKLMLASSL